MAHVGDEVAGAPEKAGAAGVEGVLDRGRIDRQEVRRGGGAGQDVRRETSPRRSGIAPLARAHVVEDPVQRPGRGEIPLPDHAEQRVRCPRRIAETPITFGRSDRGTPRRDAGELQAQSADLTGDRLPLAQGRGQAAGRPPRDGIATASLLSMDSVALVAVAVASALRTAYSLGVDELVGHLNLPGTRPPSRSPTTPGATRHDRADSGSPTAAPICATLLLPPAASGPA